MSKHVNMNELAKEIHENAVAHGWWEEERSFDDIVALCRYELSEALEEYRSGRPKEYVDDIETVQRITDPDLFAGRKPEGVAVEMADCLFRLLDWFGKEGLDVDRIIREKMEYNKSRPYRHGGKKL